MNSGPSKLAKKCDSNQAPEEMQAEIAALRHANHIANQVIEELRLEMGFKQNTIERLQHELQLYRSAKP